MNRSQVALAADSRANAKLSDEQRDQMVADLLRGASAAAIAERYGVHFTLPPLLAYKRGLITQRVQMVCAATVTEKGRAWLKARDVGTSKEGSAK